MLWRICRIELMHIPFANPWMWLIRGGWIMAVRWPPKSTRRPKERETQPMGLDKINKRGGNNSNPSRVSVAGQVLQESSLSRHPSNLKASGLPDLKHVFSKNCIPWRLSGLWAAGSTTCSTCCKCLSTCSNHSKFSPHATQGEAATRPFLSTTPVFTSVPGLQVEGLQCRRQLYSTSCSIWTTQNYIALHVCAPHLLETFHFASQTVGSSITKPSTVPPQGPLTTMGTVWSFDLQLRALWGSSMKEYYTIIYYIII